MTLTKRKTRLCLIGLLAGLIAWPVTELFINTQSSFNSYLLFNLILGLIFGAVTGSVFGTAEGLTLNLRHRIPAGMAAGAILGVIGGAAGCFTGQGLLFLMGELTLSSADFRAIGFPLARAAGWIILGGCIGMVEGIRSRSAIKIRAGLKGGLIGGLLGGLALEYSRIVINDLMLARLTGLLIFGGMVGFFYSLVEKKLSAGILRCCNGPDRGKEFLLNQRRIRIGSARKNDLMITGYNGVSEEHAILSITESKNKKTLHVKSLNPLTPVSVNDIQKTEHNIFPEDVIRVGDARFLYRTA